MIEWLFRSALKVLSKTIDLTLFLLCKIVFENHIYKEIEIEEYEVEETHVGSANFYYIKEAGTERKVTNKCKVCGHEYTRYERVKKI